jgi:hypothetical protein
MFVNLTQSVPWILTLYSGIVQAFIEYIPPPINLTLSLANRVILSEFSPSMGEYSYTRCNIIKCALNI